MPFLMPLASGENFAASVLKNSITFRDSSSVYFLLHIISHMFSRYIGKYIIINLLLF